MPVELPRLLILDAQPHRRTAFAATLAPHGFSTTEAGTPEDALDRLDCQTIDAILLDLGLPDTDAFDLITTLRHRSLMPILVLADRPSETGLLEAFERGADDYIARPVNSAKLAARLRTALRHRFQARAVEPLLEYGEIAIDPANRRVLRAGRDIKLSPTEYEILTLLTQHAGKILTHDFLLRRVWGPNKINDTQYLRVYMRSLRQKLVPPEAQRQVIQTESGIGYRFVPTRSCQSAA